jgi:hypothetical protein
MGNRGLGGDLIMSTIGIGGQRTEGNLWAPVIWRLAPFAAKRSNVRIRNTVNAATEGMWSASTPNNFGS